MTDRGGGFSSEDLIRQARESIASEDLVAKARAHLDISEPSENMERHVDPRPPSSREDEDGAAPSPLDLIPDTFPRRPKASQAQPRPQPADEPVAERIRRVPPSRSPVEPEAVRGAGLAALRKLVGVAISVVLALAAIGVFFGEEEPSSPPAPATPTADVEVAPAEVSIEGLEPGTCLQQPATDVFFEVDTVSCNEPHDFEVIGTVLLTGSDFPGEDALYDRAIGACIAEFETYVGTSYDTSIWWLHTFTPTVAGWAEGDRRATCLVFQYANEDEILRVTTSARGDGR